MPGALQQTDKLNQSTIPTNQQMGGHLNALDGLEIWVRGVIKPVAEKVLYFRTAKLPGRQADVVDDQQGDGHPVRTGPEIW